MVLNVTFGNISVISWWSVLFVEETVVPGKNHRSAQATDKLDHIMLYRIHLPWARFELTTSVVIYTDCIGSCKSNYHTIMATMNPCRREGLRCRFNLYTKRNERVVYFYSYLYSKDGAFRGTSKQRNEFLFLTPELHVKVNRYHECMLRVIGYSVMGSLFRLYIISPPSLLCQ